MARSRRPFSELLTDELRYGAVCTMQHSQRDGRSVRFKPSGHCVGCYYRLPPGPFDYQWDNLTQPYGSKYESPEAARAEHIKRVMAWQAKNKNKHAEYVARYHSKPEIAEKIRTKARETFRSQKAAFKIPSDLRTDEQQILADKYQKRLESNRKFYQNNKDAILEDHRKRYADKKD